MELPAISWKRARAGQPSFRSFREGLLLKKRGRAILFLVFVLAFLAGVVMLAYTPVCGYFHSLEAERLIAEYDSAVARLPEAERLRLLEAEREYNRSLPPGAHFQLNAEETERYRSQPDPTGTGMMGYLKIPKINASLPIYQTAGEEVLETAVGHLPGSSLPAGGESCHTALCAHRDLSTAWLFHDLDKLEIGDPFTLTVLGETLTYRVDRVTVVLPGQVEALAIEEGKDFCTLITCHPHGSTDYRLLVRGKRAEA